jgi:hypothetical protein
MTSLIILNQNIADIEILMIAINENIKYISVNYSNFDDISYINMTDIIDCDTNCLGILYDSSSPGNVPRGFELFLSKLPAHINTIDLLTCSITKRNIRYKISSYEEKYNIIIRYSFDKMGHESLMGNWILDSHNMNVKNIYFNNTIDEWKHILGIDKQ